ncbi:hypothetical protein [Chryseolinea sp. H1M3-3]|uniref:hypothetical protein n=1 Tax=Chryseolinea sp. H1M3-3 TaxID=3034144 RepID=UPI0023EB99AB|nr:hypothetical protein [Chryseolinea sp. H1M3-3]
MDAELKVGDEVYYRKSPGEAPKRKVYRIIKIEPMEVPEAVKQTSVQQHNKSLYGRETDKISQPDFSYVIEPLGGGENLTVRQGEIDTVGK